MDDFKEFSPLPSLAALILILAWLTLDEITDKLSRLF